MSLPKNFPFHFIPSHKDYYPKDLQKTRLHEVRGYKINKFGFLRFSD